MIVRELNCSLCKNNPNHESTESQSMWLLRHEERNCLRLYEWADPKKKTFLPNNLYTLYYRSVFSQGWFLFDMLCSNILKLQEPSHSIPILWAFLFIPLTEIATSKFSSSSLLWTQHFDLCVSYCIKVNMPKVSLTVFYPKSSLVHQYPVTLSKKGSYDCLPFHFIFDNTQHSLSLFTLSSFLIFTPIAFARALY